DRLGNRCQLETEQCADSKSYFHVIVFSCFSTRRWKMAMPAAGALRAKYVPQRALSAKGSNDTMTPSPSAVLTVLPPGAAGLAALEYSGRCAGVTQPQRPASASGANERSCVVFISAFLDMCRA